MGIPACSLGSRAVGDRLTVCIWSKIGRAMPNLKRRAKAPLPASGAKAGRGVVQKVASENGRRAERRPHQQSRAGGHSEEDLEGTRNVSVALSFEPSPSSFGQTKEAFRDRVH